MKKFLSILLAIAAALCLLTGCSHEFHPKDLERDYPYIVTLDYNGGTAGGRSSAKLYAKENALIPYENLTGKDFDLIPVRQSYRLSGFAKGVKNENGEIAFEKDSQGKIVLWDFSSDRVNESMTLFSVWVQNFVVQIYNQDGTLNSSREITSDDPVVTEAKLNAALRTEAGYTNLRDGYFYDPECKRPVEFPFNHTLDEANPVMAVYHRRIEGTYTLVSTLNEFRSAASSGTNMYLLNDIDCEGAQIPFIAVYNGEINGRGFTIKNFTVSRTNTGVQNDYIGLFRRIGEGAHMHDITFENFAVTGVNNGSPAFVYIGIMAGEIDRGAKFENVTLKDGGVEYSLRSVREKYEGLLCGNEAALGGAPQGITLVNCTLKDLKEE